MRVIDTPRSPLISDNIIKAWEDYQDNLESDEKLWIFKDIVDHRRKHSKNEIKVLWDDGTQSWEPLSVFAHEDPVTCAEYAFKKDILHL